jgi:hypothetical protein
MKKRKLPPSTKNEHVKRQRDPLPWRYCLLTLVCGLILVGGFFFAARQHFSAIDYSIKNSKLRQQKGDLQSEQRRLYLNREISLSPAEVKKAAKKLGMREFASESIEVVSRKAQTVNPFAEKKSGEKTKLDAVAKKIEPKEEKPKVEKIVKSEKVAKDAKEVKTETKPKADSSSSGDVRPRIAKQ